MGSKKSEDTWGTDHQFQHFGRDQHRPLQCWSHWSHLHLPASSGWLCKTWIIPSTLRLTFYFHRAREGCSAWFHDKLPLWDILGSKPQAYVWALLLELRGSGCFWILSQARHRNPAHGSRSDIPTGARSDSPLWGAEKHPREEQAR